MKQLRLLTDKPTVHTTLDGYRLEAFASGRHITITYVGHTLDEAKSDFNKRLVVIANG